METREDKQTQQMYVGSKCIGGTNVPELDSCITSSHEWNQQFELIRSLLQHFFTSLLLSSSFDCFLPLHSTQNNRKKKKLHILGSHIQFLILSASFFSSLLWTKVCELSSELELHSSPLIKSMNKIKICDLIMLLFGKSSVRYLLKLSICTFECIWMKFVCRNNFTLKSVSI